MKEAIGGYFELALNKGKEYHENAIKLNLGRTAFEYILKAKSINRIFIPYYTCDVMLDALKKTNIIFDFYNINYNLEPLFDFNLLEETDYFLYTNYFGIKDFYIEQLTKEIKNLIVDNSQSFFSKPLKGVDTFYSARKFFGVPDGAYLYTDKNFECNIERDVSYNRFIHLIKRIDLGAEAGYKDYANNESLLINEAIKTMSTITKSIMCNIDYDKVQITRNENFFYLHDNLKSINELKIETSHDSSPMIYPLFIKNGNELKSKLIENKIFVATYWPNVKKWIASERETDLVDNLICLPIDQRYGIDEMNYVLKIIGGDL